MVDTRTLAELRRHWSYYADYFNLPQERKGRLLKEQVELSRSIVSKKSIVMSASRSAGMVWSQALLPVSQLFQKYWETGTTYTEASDIDRATNLNPNFLYYLSGRASTCTMDLGSLLHTGSAAINKSKQQFKAWSTAFRSSRAAGAITMRFYCGDALAFCHALNTFKSTGNTSTGLFAAPYKASQINLDELASGTQPAPLTFDVIDTSNLIDHVGLLNLLIATPPLLKQSPSSQSVLYTETLLPSREDATKSFLDRLCTDVPTIAALFGIAPRPYVSGFTSQSHVHEIIFFKTMKSELLKLGADANVNQYHERVAWVNPCGGDSFGTKKYPALSFEVGSMARVLYGIYDKMFSNEKMATLTSSNTISRLMSMAEVNFHRESVTYLFQAVQRRVHLREGTWEQVASKFM
ncbi:hypothetical protein RSOLAG22IIIB_13293 [Rhizoctonia solani]|uniref:Uncharacterized protein n=1 Tax=Rhizoctonia solani TaxID=456999 RepID=A0A0K6FM11_9AGAM|nr:hypothetical protein RSOLAG22IIIB_13293 [Rhizoctonia solani]